MAALDPMHFDGVARDYAAARPPYPADLWRDVLATGLVAPGRRALDLGAGSGQATGELVARGMDVVAVEPGPHLAEALAKRYPRATVIRSRAEDIRPDAASFDLAVAATSIHWMDLDLVLPIVHRALTTSGRLLVWRNVFGDSAADITPFRREVERIVRRRGRAELEPTAWDLPRPRNCVGTAQTCSPGTLKAAVTASDLSTAWRSDRGTDLSARSVFTQRAARTSRRSRRRRSRRPRWRTRPRPSSAQAAR